MTDKEISLEQAIVAILSEANQAGVLGDIVGKAKAGLLGSKEYRDVGHPYVSLAIEEIENALKKINA